MSKEVSVLMPVFNSSKYLSRAIESILDQSYKGFEFLIYDDGSIDDSPEILKTYSRKDERIVIKTVNHQGYSPLLNLGIEESKGRYIARMDSDDIAFPERLEKQLRFLKENDGFVAVGSQAVRINPDGDPISNMSFALDHETIDHSQIFLGKGLILHPGSMIRRDSLLQIGGYRPEFEPGEDFDLFLRLAEVGKLANLPETLLSYRTHLTNVTITKKERHQEVKQKAIAEAYERRKLSNNVPIIGLANTSDSLHENHFIWMHMALSSGYYKTARKHALAGWKTSQKKIGDVNNLLQGLGGPVTTKLKEWRGRK